MEAQPNEIKYYSEYNAYTHKCIGSDIELNKDRFILPGKDWSYEAILKKAVTEGCNVIVKNGKTERATWYLKKSDKPFNATMQDIEKSKTCKSYKDRTVFYIDYRNDT